MVGAAAEPSEVPTGCGQAHSWHSHTAQDAVSDLAPSGCQPWSLPYISAGTHENALAQRAWPHPVHHPVPQSITHWTLNPRAQLLSPLNLTWSLGKQR